MKSILVPFLAAYPALIYVFFALVAFFVLKVVPRWGSRVCLRKVDRHLVAFDRHGRRRRVQLRTRQGTELHLDPPVGVYVADLADPDRFETHLWTIAVRGNLSLKRLAGILRKPQVRPYRRKLAVAFEAALQEGDSTKFVEALLEMEKVVLQHDPVRPDFMAPPLEALSGALSPLVREPIEGSLLGILSLGTRGVYFADPKPEKEEKGKRRSDSSERSDRPQRSERSQPVQPAPRPQRSEPSQRPERPQPAQRAPRPQPTPPVHAAEVGEVFDPSVGADFDPFMDEVIPLEVLAGEEEIAQVTDVTESELRSATVKGKKEFPSRPAFTSRR